MLQKAIDFATYKHKTQFRKYTGESYIVHPMAVMEMLRTLEFHETILCAAILHDTVEDTNTTIQELEENFGIQVSRMVEDLTDLYTSENFPHIGRKNRKKLECLDC